ncbi:MAG TPA: PH domain-containing protein [Actinomycetota bacterium]|nr:PH domain-containing protein [Actinomycetota bacterium]
MWVIEGVGGFGLGAIPLILLNRRWAMILLAVLGFGALSAIVRYLRFFYIVEADTIILEGGFLNRWRRVIPFPRIQSVDMVQKLRHRAFGVVELRIEAAGGAQTEGALVALAPDEAERLRGLLLVGSEVPPRPDMESPPLARLGPGMLLVAGITGGRVAVIAALLGYLQELLPDRIIQDSLNRLERLSGSGVMLVVGIVVTFLVLSLIISIIATIVVYWNFTLRREGGRLVVTRGLLEKRRAVVPLSRLQAVRMEENLIRLVFGMASLRAVNAGVAGRSDEEQQTSMLLPVATRAQALAVAAHLLGKAPEELGTPLEPAPRRALVRRFGWALIPGILIAIGGWLFSTPVAVAGVGLLPPGALLGFASWRSLGHTIDADMAVTRGGVLVRRTAFVPLKNLQHLALSVSPLQRLLDLGTIRMHVPRAAAAAIDVSQIRADQRFHLLAGVMVPRTGDAGEQVQA